MLPSGAFLPPEEFPLHTEAADPALPDAFGPFRVLHQIGVGALGPVFRAFDPQRDRMVAVKVLRLDLPNERLQQLAAELEHLIAAELSHPSIAAPIATGLVGHALYLAQDYVAADSLDAVVREYGPAPPPDAFRLAAQLAGALDFAAAVGITHGALHPRDVLVAHDEVRLTGLGVARALERVGVSAPVRRFYTAPERAAGGAWDRRADVFSLAVLMYEVLWGRSPAADGTEVVASLPELAGGDLTALRAVFGRALAEDPAGRFPTALEFAEALKEAFPAAERRLPADALLPLDGLQTEPVVQPFKAADLDRTELSVLPTSDPELELRTARATRYHDVETAPAIASPAIDALPIDRARIEPESSARGREAALRDSYSSGTARSVADPPRPARWAVALAMIAGLVGMALAFAGGYAVGIRDRSPRALVDARPPAATPSPRTGPAQGREFTEGAVSEPANPSADAGRKSDTPGAPVEANTPTDKPDGKTPVQPDAALPAAVGQLLVRSTPSGARVFVDGRDRGETPATIRDLPHGTHRLRIVRDGYAAEERRVVLTASRPSQSLIIELERPRLAQSSVPTPATPGTVGRFVGALTVDSRPQGARVFVDGRLVGTTPVSLPEVNAGSHAVRLEREGYRRWSSSVRIVASERNRVTASLER